MLSLAAFAWLLTLVPTDTAARAYTAYGGVYICASLLWLWWWKIPGLTCGYRWGSSLPCRDCCHPIRTQSGISKPGGGPPRLEQTKNQLPETIVNRLRSLSEPGNHPALSKAFALARPALGLGADQPSPRILLLYGSLRERSFSQFAVEEAARLLHFFGAETRSFDPSDLPLPDQVTGDDHPAVHELREHAFWSEGMVWCSPERHGQITGIMKAQIDHLPLEMKGRRPTQGRTLAVMQVSGGSQSFNAVNSLRLLGRWMRMITIPNQSSVAMAYKEFDEAGRMRASSYYERIVDVMKELVRFTVLTRPHAAQLVDRYSERKAAGISAEDEGELPDIGAALR